ncbi:aromatic compound dioxygenase [Obba rivulosa]|uniref:Aromatic compound dioxygenase n=1 Tax=Obba rivulosa TaxID=1052685 RepID=A0A8E2AIR4_9APHY|nr:aromatic compound dioxygenase [Obba rivulosa]
MSPVPTFDNFAFASYVGVSLLTRILAIIRNAFQLLIPDNPLLYRLFNKRNPEWHDVEGPYYVLGAPSRNIAEGKAVLASRDILRGGVPFLLCLTIKDVKGNPIPHAEVDCWQADTNGSYYFRSYTLRGKLTTDFNGYVEALTAVPGEYGPKGSERPGHIHMRIRDRSGQHHELTTQVYVCSGNDPEEMYRDPVKYLRTPKTSLVMKAWSVPSANNDEKYKNLPELPNGDVETVRKVAWWNSKLAETGSNAKIVAGGHMELGLAPRRAGLLGLLGF